MSGDSLAIVVGVAGVLAGGLISEVFYRRTKADLRREVADLRVIVTNVLAAVSERSPSRTEIEQTVKRAGGDDATAASIADSLESPTEKSAATILVRAALGPLQDARGEVDLPRLVREASAVGSSYSDVVEALRALRSEGMVEWDGGSDDLSGITIIRVNP